jgi:crotonobetainyl-CoA:carnitine CoA-transferase CaiB-like acyl-CoA transferase
MGSYDFLSEIRVIEVAQLGPSSLGGYLADMGAEVLKVEGPDGDPIRHTGSPAVGTSQGDGLMHLRWNRGKRSIGVDLKKQEGKQIFRQLAASSHIVIEGTRAGVLDGLGLGFDTLRTINPRIVFCSLSGLGSTGPYQTLGSHAPAFDAFAGLGAVNAYASTSADRENLRWTPVGMHAMGLNAAIGTLAALNRAQRTGKGAYIEVTGAESAAHWVPDGVDKVLNASLLHPREPAFTHHDGRMIHWPRLHEYATRDGGKIFFQALYPKFWRRFCEAIDRPGLVELDASPDDALDADERVHGELVRIFLLRRRHEWMEFFLENDVPGIPVNTIEDLATDPHFLARQNIYEVESPGCSTLRLTATPIKTTDQAFEPALAPSQWQHTEDVLMDLLNLDRHEIDRLREAEVIFTSEQSARPEFCKRDEPGSTSPCHKQISPRK